MPAVIRLLFYPAVTFRNHLPSALLAKITAFNGIPAMRAFYCYSHPFTSLQFHFAMQFSDSTRQLAGFSSYTSNHFQGKEVILC